MRAKATVARIAGGAPPGAVSRGAPSFNKSFPYWTITVPLILGWMAQKYSNVPAVLNGRGNVAP